MKFQRFNPSGPTVLIGAIVTASTGVQIASVGTQPAEQYRIYNDGAATVTVFVGFGVTPQEAQANAAPPTGVGVNAKRCLVVPAQTAVIVSASLDAYWSAVTASSTAAVYITPGHGF